MIFDADLVACAGIVEHGDPDRFAACMALPLSARGKLFPLYALNVEIARAPWVTKEPAIAEIRLQWWSDVLEEIATGAVARRHEVVRPLSEILTPDMTQSLQGLIAARRQGIHGLKFEDEVRFREYLDATTGSLQWIAALALGADQGDEKRLRRVAFGVALANWFLAVPALERAGHHILPNEDREAIAELGRKGLASLCRQSQLSRPSRQSLLAGWRTRSILGAAIRHPARVKGGDLAHGKSVVWPGLLRATLTGRI